MRTQQRVIARATNPISDRRRILCLAVAIVAGQFALFLLSNIDTIARTENSDYPFGSDVATYLHGQGMWDRHWLTTKFFSGYRKLLGLLGVPFEGIAAKAPFAAIGAANVAVAIAAFASLRQRFDVRSTIYGSCFGFALSHWYFASVPESYALTTLLYSGYILGLIFLARSPVPQTLPSAALAMILLIALYNDISIVALTIIPLVIYRAVLFSTPQGRRFVFLHAAAVSIFLFQNSLSKDLFAHYFNIYLAYTPIPNAIATRHMYEFDLTGAIMNFFFYAIGAPQNETTYAPLLAHPQYRGFFDPSPLSYLTSTISTIFLALYVWLISFIRASRMTRLTVGLSTFILLRFLLVLAFNPVEAILYCGVIVLPLLLVLFQSFEASKFPYKTTFASTFALALFVTNFKFFFTT